MNFKKIPLQFFLLMWKNFLLQFRRPIGTIFEIIIPILGLAILILLRLTLSTNQNFCFSTFEATSLQFEPLTLSTTTPPNLFSRSCNFTYFYTPQTPQTDAIVNRTKQILSIPNLNLNFIPTSSELEIERLSSQILNSINTSNPTTNPYVCQILYSQSGIYRPIVAGLIFDELDSEIEVTIRLNQDKAGINVQWNTDSVEPSFSTASPRTIPNPYIDEGFLTLQDALVQSVIDYKISNKTQNNYNHGQLPIDIRQFPYPQYQTDFFLVALTFLLPLLLVFSFIYTAGTITKEIVIEKETRLRESMKMMGLLNWVNWLAWFTKQMIFMIVVVAILSLELHFGQIFTYSNFLIIFIWLLLYVCYMISLSFLVSTFFTSARLGLLISFLVWFLSFLPYFFLFTYYDDLPLYAKLLSCLLGNTCLSLSVSVIVSREVQNIGVQWDNIASPTSATDDFNLLLVFAMLVLVSVVQFLLTWYLDEVLPKKYGLRKPFYFPFTLSYWFGYSSRCCVRSRVFTSETNTINDTFEVEPADQEVGIRIVDLTKKYTRRKTALDNLKLNLYKGQITVLLGHNGAGKSTLISILTGLFPPTKG